MKFVFVSKVSSYRVIIFVEAWGPRMKLKGRSIGVGMLQAMGPRKKAARGREEMNQDTL